MTYDFTKSGEFMADELLPSGPIEVWPAGWQVFDDYGETICLCPDEHSAKLVVRALNTALRIHRAHTDLEPVK